MLSSADDWSSHFAHSHNDAIDYSEHSERSSTMQPDNLLQMVSFWERDSTQMLRVVCDCSQKHKLVL